MQNSSIPNSSSSSSLNQPIFSIGSTSTYNYSTSNNSTPTHQQLDSNSKQTVNTLSYVEIQAQFELSIELRKFINIDLFQRGYYQIRLNVKCSNKQIPTKIILQLESNKNNQNLSESMFPSSIMDEYAVSKTFLILYRNEEINLDDQFIFKISTLLNAFNLVESFEKLGLEMNVELWFTENDYNQTNVSFMTQLENSFNPQNQQNLNNSQTNQQQQQQNVSLNQSNMSQTNSQMQQLCSRNFKIKFDPRIGLHLQLPCVFDYFHLSSVLVTIHCALLTLLPPVMIGNNFQRNLTLSSILFGKDLSQFKNSNEITSNLINRAVYLFNQICSLLLTSYESLQQHIIKITSFLNEYEKKSLKFEFVDCKEKLKKLNQIIQSCDDPETISDLANCHVAQCSAENIMLWGLYLDHLSLNQTISPYLAIDYHIKRLKRFSETFIVKDIAKKSLLEFNINQSESEQYLNQLHDMIRQSNYYQQLPDLIVSCDDLDGLPDQLPIVFEENYVSFNTTNSDASNSKSSSISSLFSSSTNNSETNLNSQANSSNRNKLKHQLSERKGSQSSNENNSAASTHSYPSQNLSYSSKQLQRKFKKKLTNTGDSLENFESTNKSIQLVSYRKTKTELDFFNSNASNQVQISSSNSALQDTTTSCLNINHDRLSKIKAELALSTTPLSSPRTNHIINKEASNQASNNVASASDLLFGNLNLKDQITELNQIDISLNEDSFNENNSNNLNETNRKSTPVQENLNNLSVNKADKDGPLDCSFKSRALYESFRGKVSTLERPKRYLRKSVLNNSFHAHHNNQLSSTSSYDDNKETKIVDLIKKELNESNSKLKKLSLTNETLQQQTVSSLSSLITNENLYKFVLIKEEFKKQLFSKYHNSNLYSEFSSYFCTAPYFYPELTPKLTLTNNTTTIENKLNKSNNHSKTIRASFMSTLTSKSKLLNKILNSNNNKHNSDHEDDDDDSEPDEQQENEDDEDEDEQDNEKIHLIVCVHGLDGNSGDLRLVRTYLELALPGAKMDFLMSEHNQESTFDDIQIMTEQLIREIENHIENYGIDPYRISFIGHSLGNLIVRSTVAHDNFKPYLSKLYTYLSLSGPHLGTLYNSSGLVNMGLWLIQKWKKSGSLLQLSLKDNPDLYKTFLYKLSKKPTFECFKNILLVASPQDRYVPFHSARVDICKQALKDNGQYGQVYREMLNNILKPIQNNPNITFKRYSAFYTLPNGPSNLIGRAAHVAVLDSEFFVEKLILVSVAKYFR